ncbi:hypothetical protein KR067_001769 [Drosophila pandora]|nr:hypothetical protein KR067_001769 [Drosophila pandora]
MNINWNVSVVQSEYKKIDKALEICCSMEEEIDSCLKNVEQMNQKYNAPGRYTIDMEPFRSDYPSTLIPTVSSPEVTSVQNVDSEMEMLGQLYGARSAQELDETYVDVRYKFIKLKRELEGTVAHCQRVVDHAERQKKVTHRMLRGSQSTKKHVCVHK